MRKFLLGSGFSPFIRLCSYGCKLKKNLLKLNFSLQQFKIEPWKDMKHKFYNMENRLLAMADGQIKKKPYFS